MGNAMPAQAPRRAGLAQKGNGKGLHGRAKATQSMGTGWLGTALEKHSAEELWRGDETDRDGKATPVPDMRRRSMAEPIVAPPRALLEMH